MASQLLFKTKLMHIESRKASRHEIAAKSSIPPRKIAGSAKLLKPVQNFKYFQ